MTASISTVSTIVLVFTMVNAMSIIPYTLGKYRQGLPPDGWMFDAAFGFECVLNVGVGTYVAVEIRKTMLYKTLIPKATIRAIGGFELWHSITTTFCYCCSMVLAKYASKHMKLDDLRGKVPNVTDEQIRGQIFYTFAAIYTVIAIIKCSLLYVVFDFHKTAKQTGGDLEVPVAYYFAGQPGVPATERGQPIMGRELTMPAQGGMPVMRSALETVQPATVVISYVPQQMAPQSAARRPSNPQP